MICDTLTASKQRNSITLTKTLTFFSLVTLWIDSLQYFTHAAADGHLNVQVYCRKAKSPSARYLTFQVFQDQHSVATSPTDNNTLERGPCLWKETVRMNPYVDSCTISGMVDSIQAWTAETPHLYTIVISLSYDDGNKGIIYQSESCRIGFRTISIAHGQLLVNNRAITVCGMNRHEHDPDHGKTVTIESIQLDVSLLKQNNFNAVRTSHYPNRSAFYRVCDYYGLYVCDEANVETHGMKVRLLSKGALLSSLYQGKFLSHSIHS